MRKWIIVLLAFVTGCAVWHQTDGTFSGADYTLDLPKGWMVTNDPKNLRITRDGTALQQILVFIGDIAEQDKNAKKKLKKGMLPQEVAESILDRMRSDKSLIQFTVVENEPALIGGEEGFRLVCTYTKGKVRYRTIYYGMLRGEKFYRISYSAPIRYYFDKDVASFEEIVKSLKLVEEKKPAVLQQQVS